jgi:hypothetical protein
MGEDGGEADICPSPWKKEIKIKEKTYTRY